MERKRRGRQRAREEAVHGRSQNREPVNGSIHALPVPRLLSLASCLSLTHTPKSYYYLVPPLPLPSQSPALTPSKTLPGLQCSGSGSGSQRKITSVDVK
ncbi:hypothetical protein CUMW_085680 [Citrus unshiu]|nr:hypothetical protein CUMW_085680 [Citrus unshiu]